MNLTQKSAREQSEGIALWDVRTLMVRLIVVAIIGACHVGTDGIKGNMLEKPLMVKYPGFFRSMNVCLAELVIGNPPEI